MKLVNSYTVRPLEEKDLQMILSWRNDCRIHIIMLTDHEITWNEHINWFNNIKDATPKRNLVFMYNNKPVGYIGYTEYDSVNQSCSPGAYLAPDELLPLDAGMVLFYYSCAYAFDVLKMKRLNTDVFAKNKKAVKIDKFLGYQIDQDEEHSVIKNGKEEKVFRMVLTKEQWSLRKKYLDEIIE